VTTVARFYPGGKDLPLQILLVLAGFVMLALLAALVLAVYEGREEGGGE
jgi:hypothetical protein